MPDPTQPQLGYGKASEATLDQVNIWMRGTPWYQSLLTSWGQDPGHPHDLSDSQKAQIVKGAQANGVVVDQGSQEIDDNGNFRMQGHKLRNTLIVAGIAAATIATMGAAGVFGGAAGLGAGGVEAGATAGLDASVASGALAGGAGAGLGGAAATGAATAAGLGGVEAGAASGLGAAALPGAGTALGGATAAEAAGAAAAGGAAPLASSATVPTAAGTTAGGTGLTAAGTAGDGSTLAAGSGAVDSAAGGGSTLSKLSNLAGDAGKAIGSATTAAGNNALNQEQLGLTANGQNIQGQSAFETELMNRAKTEASQRQGALADVYRQSYFTNGGTGSGPRVSPYNPAGSPTQSPDYLSALSSLKNQGMTKLATGAQYDTNAMAPLTPYKPIDPKDVQGATNTKPSALQTAGEWVSPALSTLSALSKFWGK